MRRTSFSAKLLRRLLAGLAVVMLLAAPAAAAEYASVSKDGVNIRSGPATDKEILWELFKGFPLQILERKGQWVQIVDFEGDKGWIYTPLLSKEKTVIVRADSGNLRVGPGTNYEIAASVKYGVVFKPLERRGEWVKVQHADGTSGWMHDKLLWPDILP